MTRSLYIVGGPGTGKSSLLRAILRLEEFGPVEEIAVAHNSRGSRIALRGQRLSSGGVYLGILRDEFPGTDALDNVSHIPGVAWLESGDLPERIVGEGLVLTTAKFLSALANNTDLMLLHLWCSPEETARRFALRGSEQKDSWVRQATTRANNARVSQDDAALCLTVDTTEWGDHPEDRNTVRDLARDWLLL